MLQHFTIQSTRRSFRYHQIFSSSQAMITKVSSKDALPCRVHDALPCRVHDAVCLGGGGNMAASIQTWHFLTVDIFRSYCDISWGRETLQSKIDEE